MTCQGAGACAQRRERDAPVGLRGGAEEEEGEDNAEKHQSALHLSASG